jgi:hypothetical protein
MAETEHHILTREGDGTPDVEAALARLAARGVTREAAGLHKHLYVTRARQTVVMVASAEAPLAAELRGLPGWQEPGDRPLDA